LGFAALNVTPSAIVGFEAQNAAPSARVVTEARTDYRVSSTPI